MKAMDLQVSRVLGRFGVGLGVLLVCAMLLAAAPAEPEALPAQEASYLDELERLAGLRDQGVITEEEFAAKKGQLLGL